MHKIDQNAQNYDEMFHSGGFQGVYDLPVKHSCYYPLYKVVLKEFLRSPETPILEVGCGTGGLSQLLLDKGYPYKGFDFSSIAVDKAVQRTNRQDCFWVGDAFDAQNYTFPYSTILCLEVLEHVDDDIKLTSLWKSRSRCICSVPNFDSPLHVRFFQSPRDVLQRYGEILQIQTIIKLKKPALSDISLKSYIRNLVWSRYKPRRILEILGFGSFESVGGWFVFVGRRR